MLDLKASPTKLVESLLIHLHHDTTLGLQLIAEESVDSAVLQHLMAFGAHENVCRAMNEVIDAMNWYHGLVFLHRAYSRKLIRRIPISIISTLRQFISKGSELPCNLVHQSLLMLVAVRRFGRLRYTDDIFDHLSTLLMTRQEPLLQEASLQLLNYLVNYPNNQEEEEVAKKKVLNQKIVGCICDHILRGKPSAGMGKQLFLYQVLLLRTYWYRKVKKVLPGSLTDVAESLTEGGEKIAEGRR